MTRAYSTVAREAVAEIEIKRSRFLSYVRRVETEAAARDFIEVIRRKHWDARHVCPAFVLGPSGNLARSSDDGEPAGTAGAPILEAVRGSGLSDVVVVVARYFGGTLLGAGGLVRAYSQSAKAGLDGAGVQERRMLRVWEVQVAHSDAGRIENDFRARGIQVRGVEYGDSATLRVATDRGLGDLIASLTSGAAQAVEVGEEWVDV